MVMPRPTVVYLLFFSCPADVARLVVTVVVGIAVNRMQWGWAASDISQKLFEARPALAHFDAAPAVPMPIRQLVIGAALMHCSPRIIFRGLVVCAGFAVCGVCRYFATT